jgi:uncharacterized integral membrane protein
MSWPLIVVLVLSLLLGALLGRFIVVTSDWWNR